jgi:chromosome segregation protein
MPARLQALGRHVACHDAGLSALLADWLQGCYTAPNLEDALACRSQLQAGETLFVASRPCGGTQQRGVLCARLRASRLAGRAQEIENLDKQLRAQALIAEESRAHRCGPKRPMPMPRSA